MYHLVTVKLQPEQPWTDGRPTSPNIVRLHIVVELNKHLVFRDDRTLRIRVVVNGGLIDDVAQSCVLDLHP